QYGKQGQEQEETNVPRYPLVVDQPLQRIFTCCCICLLLHFCKIPKNKFQNPVLVSPAPQPINQSTIQLINNFPVQPRAVWRCGNGGFFSVLPRRLLPACG